MNLLIAAVAFLFAATFVLVGVTRIGAWRIEARYPPVGAFVKVDGTRLHVVHVPAPAEADLPPIVFIHGASANLNDQMVPLRPLVEGRAELLFFDRPGHGWSERGQGNETPQGQAKTIAALMDAAGIDKAIIVGHSFGGAMAIAFALAYPERTLGLIFASAATHPWPGGKTSWYYELTTKPVLGWMFSETLTYAAGSRRMQAATDCVFAPNHTPDNYLQRARIPLVLRPSAFRANANDVQSLYAFATANAASYPTISAPTIVISGDADTVVYEAIHSVGLARDIPSAELVWVHNLGHKPDWIAPDLIVAGIEKVAGKLVDLQAKARAVEARIAGDRQGEGVCINVPAPG